MNSEFIFKVFFTLIFFPFIMIWIWKFIVSGLNKKSFYTQREGIISAFLFRFFLTVSLISIFIYLFYPTVLGWSYVIIPNWVRYMGFIIGLFSIILISWTLKILGNHFFASLNLRENHKLITIGLYRWIRHPLYVLFNLIWVCFFLISSNILIGVSGIIAYFVIYVGRVSREEKMMIDFFGKDYLDYKRKTGKYFPKLFYK